MNKYIALLMSFTLIFLFGCEYNEDEVYYEELTPPDEIAIDINLDELENGSILYIYRKTRVRYNANLNGRNFLSYKIKLGNKDLYIPENGILYFDPRDYQEFEELDLTIDIAFKAGTNSIAESLGLEKYLKSFNYKLKLIHGADLSLEFEQTITQDKKLKVSWKPLELEQLRVSKYEVYKSNGFEDGLLTTITNPFDAFFIDESHVLGKQEYLILTYFEDDKIEKLWDYYTVQIEYPSGSLNSDPIGFDKMKICWDEHIYDCNYALELEDGRIIDCKDKKEVEIEHNYNFPISQDVKLHLYPVSYTGDLTKTPYSVQSLMSCRIKDIFLNGKIVCNKKDKILYVKEEQKLLAVDMNTMKILPNVYIDTGYDWNWSNLFMHYSDYFERLFYLTADKITIYDNKLNKISHIDTIEKDIKNCSILQSTIDGKIIVGYSDYSACKIYVYDIATKKMLYSETMSLFYLHSRWSASKNGTYVCASRDNYIQIFSFNDIEMFEVNKVVVDFLNVEECFFSQVDDEEFYVLEKGKFCRVNALTKNKTPYVAGRFITEDPFTGNVAYVKENNVLVILNAEMDEEIYSIPVSRAWYLRLFNNMLTTDMSGLLYYLDLNPYIQ